MALVRLEEQPNDVPGPGHDKPHRRVSLESRRDAGQSRRRDGDEQADRHDRGEEAPGI